MWQPCEAPRFSWGFALVMPECFVVAMRIDILAFLTVSKVTSLTDGTVTQEIQEGVT